MPTAKACCFPSAMIAYKEIVIKALTMAKKINECMLDYVGI
jgi:hypothetical protein